MILFLFGTWGAGKSYVGNMIEEKCGLPHFEADLHFDPDMVSAIHDRTFHAIDLEPYYGRIITEIRGYARRSEHFVVSQGVYRETYRRMIYQAFAPDIRFVWVQTENGWLQKWRLWLRSRRGNPITPKVHDYMLPHWDPPAIPHDTLPNNRQVEAAVRGLLERHGLCYYWGDEGENSFPH